MMPNPDHSCTTMHPTKVNRQQLSQLSQLTDLPNIGKASAADLRLLGITSPAQLQGRDAYQMYASLCELTGQRHDPCVIDVFLSVIRFVEGEEPQAWWAFTDERKRTLSERS